MPELSETALAVNDALLEALAERRFADLVTVVAAPHGQAAEVGAKLLVDRAGSVTGSLGQQALDDAVLADAQRVMTERRSQVIAYPLTGSDQEIEVFHEVLEPQPQMLILGAGHIAVPLARFAKDQGFEVIVLDDRDKYASEERFPGADEVIAADFGE